MKNFLVVVIALFFSIVFTACGKNNQSTDLSTPISSSVGNKDATAIISTSAPLPKGMRECGKNDIALTFNLINGVRAKGNVSALVQSTKLMIAARERSITMAGNSILSHSGWDTTINSTGYTWSYAGENIAYGYTSSSAVVNGWVHSPGHYANIMTQSYTETGIGCVIDSNGTYWWTQDFGTP